ncbi:MAG TPA: four helix bundle protein, partial [Tepidisphaeraceae bacterium]|nr:four helix bundle protein [Tepidisphaeraceae bacterium]
ENSKQYDLEERIFQFAKHVRAFVKLLPRTEGNRIDVRQLLRASGSVGANYIEANESLSKKDFLYRIRVCRKESKECRFHLRLLDTGEQASIEKQRCDLIQESVEFVSIFSSILKKSE